MRKYHRKCTKLQADDTIAKMKATILGMLSEVQVAKYFVTSWRGLFQVKDLVGDKEGYG